MKQLSADSPHPRVQASALFVGAVLRMNSFRTVKERERIAEVFLRLQKEYSATPYAQRAEGYLFELNHLQIGMEAPDFDAVDADGVKFKLSDYRGKVVVVDFWGFW